MSGSGSEGAGSGLGPGLPISKNVMISMAGPGGSGWSGYILLFAIGGGKTAHKDILVMTKNRGVHKGKGKTRTYPDHPDPSRVSEGLRTTPYPDPTRTHLDPTRTRCLTKGFTARRKLSQNALTCHETGAILAIKRFLCGLMSCGGALRKTPPASQVKNA